MRSGGGVGELQSCLQGSKRDRGAGGSSLPAGRTDADQQPVGYLKGSESRRQFESYYRNSEFFLNSTMSIDGAPADKYVLTDNLRDLANGRTTRVEQPFTIKDGAAETK